MKIKMIGFLGRDHMAHGDLFRFEINDLFTFATFLAYIPEIYKEVYAHKNGWFVDVWCSEAYAYDLRDDFADDCARGGLPV